MVAVVANAQQALPVHPRRIARLAHRAIRHLDIRTPGELAITFISSQRMRALNRRFLHHDRPTDVLSFRYDGEAVVGELLIVPSQACAYATRHGVSYRGELARYVIHGLLHWLGHEDDTPVQQRKMRAMEDHLLVRCGVK